MKKQMKRALAGIGVFLASAVQLVQAAPLGTAFTYQGQLTEGGQPAQGIFDFRVSIFDAACGGNVVAGPITNSAVLVSNGLFTVMLDFGSGVFTGDARWLEIGVRTNGGGAFTPVSPRQPVAPAPYALYATNAGTAAYAEMAGSATTASTTPWAGLTGVPAGFADGLDNDTIYSAGTGLQLLGTVFNAHFAGSGTASTVARSDHDHAGVYAAVAHQHDAADLASGTLDDARLSANVALLNSSPTFTGTVTAGEDIRASRLNVGQDHELFGFGATIAGGWWNTIGTDADFSAIGGGFNNNIGGFNEAATIAGGSENAIGIGSEWSSIGGGSGNIIGVNSAHATIAGGARNTNAAAGSTIAGGSFNSVGVNSWDSAIGGGNDNHIAANSESTTIAGGSGNTIGTNAYASAIGGGSGNIVGVSSANATIAGGKENTNAATCSTIAGGFRNSIGSASGHSAIGGGYNNIIAANATFATIPGGFSNFATNHAFAAGNRAKAQHTGAFVWGDSTPADFASTAPNQFLIRATGGVGIGKNNPATELDVNGTVAAIAFRGSGADLTGLNGNNLSSGTVAEARIDPSVARDTEVVPIILANDGAGSGLDADLLDGQHAAAFAPAAHSHDAAEITSGTLTDDRLSGNVALRNSHQTFSGSNTFGGVLLATNVANQLAGNFTGNGAGVTNLSPANLAAGTAPINISGQAATVGPNGVANASLEADAVTSDKIADSTITAADVAENTFWQTSGNAGTTVGTHFVGTTDNRPLEFRANHQRALRLEGGPNTGDYFNIVNVVAGSRVNFAAAGVYGVTIGGGGAENFFGVAVTNSVGAGSDFATIGGGAANRIYTDARYATIGGGAYNSVLPGGNYASIGSGGYNAIYGSANGTTIAGGYGNTVRSDASYATIGGGLNNTIAARAECATIPGGRENTATNYAFAAGRRAKANHTGAFVWGDFTDADIVSTNSNSVTMRASGGYRLFSNSGATAGVYLSAGGGSWTSMCDRNAKEDFQPVNPLDVLAKVAALPVTTWKYKTQDASIRHIGPTAQDFHAAFGVGETDTGIASIDADGVALAAIQGLNQKLEETRAENTELKRELAEVKRLLQQILK